MFEVPRPLTVQRVKLSSTTLVSTKKKWLASSSAMSPSSPTSSWAGSASRLARPGMSFQLTPSVEVHIQDWARTPIGALGSRATASQ